jgi:hypothetical protein
LSWSLLLREEHKLIVVENRKLRRKTETATAAGSKRS